jgi:hypothetical protein
MAVIPWGGNPKPGNSKPGNSTLGNPGPGNPKPGNSTQVLAGATTIAQQRSGRPSSGTFFYVILFYIISYLYCMVLPFIRGILMAAHLNNLVEIH